MRADCRRHRRGRTIIGADVQRHELASRARPEQSSPVAAVVSLSCVVGKGKRFVALALVIIIVVVVAVAALRFALAVLSCA